MRGAGGALYMGESSCFLDEGFELGQMIGKIIRPRSPKEGYLSTTPKNLGCRESMGGLAGVREHSVIGE